MQAFQQRAARLLPCPRAGHTADLLQPHEDSGPEKAQASGARIAGDGVQSPRPGLVGGADESPERVGGLAGPDRVRVALGAVGEVSQDVRAGEVLAAQVWLAQVGRVPLLMLDSYVEENDPELHEVTDRLYGGGTEHRLRQELLLGVGGVRAVRAFCAITGHPEPEVFHTNEGHAGFLGLERIREYVASGLAFDEATELSRAGTVFTTHTPVPAGIDRFPRSLVERYFGAGSAGDLPLDRVLALGAGPRPGFGVPPGSITNGVHASSWVTHEVVFRVEADHEARSGVPRPLGTTG